ncbi:MAG: hypothetical protein QM734_01925 [Cyclobacteriaceae bacterium]
MTTMNDPIRQASLFTMNGLIDPRLMPGYVAPKRRSTKLSMPFFAGFQLIWRRFSWR